MVDADLTNREKSRIIEARTAARDLHAIACHYFAGRPSVPHPLDPARRDDLRRLFRRVLAPIFAEVVHANVGESRAAFEARAEAALHFDADRPV